MKLVWTRPDQFTWNKYFVWFPHIVRLLNSSLNKSTYALVWLETLERVRIFKFNKPEWLYRPLGVYPIENSGGHGITPEAQTSHGLTGQLSGSAAIIDEFDYEPGDSENNT